ncbi:MAG: DUF1365 domain-containing protein [Pseudomonadota bacterium]
MSLQNSRLCWGTVVHRRYRPKHHELRYKVFSLLLDLDELTAADASLRLFSVNRSNLVSFRERDHGEGSAAGLKADILQRAARQGAEVSQVLMLCYPRVFGYAFNPLTVYYCYGTCGRMTAIVYQVNNTFGGRQFYTLSVTADDRAVAQACDKKMYVSPFNAVEGGYEFHVSPPGETLAVGVNLRVDGRPVLKAYHTASTEPLTDASLARALAAMPLMTFKVIAAIHFEALKLWLKGLRMRPRPRARTARTATLD